jgi:hypothetical protein
VHDEQHPVGAVRPDTLELWVANADGENVASHTRFTHYNLKDLLAPAAAPSRCRR